MGIHGKCQSNYATEEDKETKDMTITQVVDLSNCREKAAIYRGMATAVLDQVAKQVRFYPAADPSDSDRQIKLAKVRSAFCYSVFRN